MYQTKTGRYDEIPHAMQIYINNYGCHFNKKLCIAASKRMYRMNNGKKEKVKLFNKEEIEELLNKYNISLERNILWDAVYVGNMCINDFYESSITSEENIAKFIKDMIDDADAAEGYIFNRFYADSMFMNKPIDWEDMI